MSTAPARRDVRLFVVPGAAHVEEGRELLVREPARVVEDDARHAVHRLVLRRLGDRQSRVVAELERGVIGQRHSLDLEVVEELVALAEVVEEDHAAPIAQERGERPHIERRLGV